MHLGAWLAVHAVNLLDQVDVHVLDLGVVLNLPVLLQLFANYEFLELADALVHGRHYLHFQCLNLLRTPRASRLDGGGFFEFDQYFKRKTAVVRLTSSAVCSWRVCCGLILVRAGLRGCSRGVVGISWELVRVDSRLRGVALGSYSITNFRLFSR